MDPRPESEGRFSRESRTPRLVAARAEGAPDAELEAFEVLSRLEHQAAESGRLEGRVQMLERSLKAERDARRRLADRMRRERAAAEAIYERAQRAEAAHALAAEEVQRLADAASRAEQQTQLTWAQLAATEHALALKTRPVWRKLLRRPPSAF